jgi:hypothetical protein
VIKRIVLLIIFFATTKLATAQYLESFEHTGEFGISAGVAHYFGDLNQDINFDKPKQSFAIHYTKQMNNYVGIKISATYAFLAYADKYSNNIIQQTRNLSFNTDVYEFSVNGTFNFFQFNPGFEGYNYTPYIGIGIGIFSYDPYTFYKGEKYYLRTIGTEGQGSDFYPTKTPYKNTATCIPLTLGFKYAFSPKMNVFAEFRYRFTNTDYLDDVSTTYAPKAFAANSIGAALSDRSSELGLAIGQEGRQRGNTLANDAFATFHLGVSFNFEAYRCPNQSYRY